VLEDEQFDDGYKLCPDHGDTLQYAADQGDDEEHLECKVCDYQVAP
jgi:hypothetical protein